MIGRMFDPHLATDVLPVVNSVLYTAEFMRFVLSVSVCFRDSTWLALHCLCTWLCGP